MIYLFNISLFDIIDMIIEYINDISLKKKKKVELKQQKKNICFLWPQLPSNSVLNFQHLKTINFTFKMQQGCSEQMSFGGRYQIELYDSIWLLSFHMSSEPEVYLHSFQSDL